jgi:hypothetical protein
MHIFSMFCGPAAKHELQQQMITDPDIAMILGYVLLLRLTGGWSTVHFGFPYSELVYMHAFYSVVNDKDIGKNYEWPEWAR